jgi:pimeloyl-ACP methyl ester carboxylesterase
VWGHSQGGQSALWTGILARHYAPEVELAGVVGIAPAANMKRILETNVAANKRLGPYVARSYSRFYPDIGFEAALRPDALAAAPEIAGLCGFLPPDDPQRIEILTGTFDGPAMANEENAALARRLAENTADRTIAVPVLIAQGLADSVVQPQVTDAWVEERCDAGQRLEYWTFVGRDHDSIVRPGTPLEEPLVAWTAARFASRPQAAGCTRKSF